MKRGRPPHPETLTPREQEVLALLRQGLTNQAIGERLGISEAGAAYHVGEILSKLQVSTRQEAAHIEPSVAQRRTWSLSAVMSLLAKLRDVSIPRAFAATVIAGAVCIFALLSIGAGLTLLNGDGSPGLSCVTGEEAENPVLQDGAVRGVTKNFETVEKVESFLCSRLRHPRLERDWELRQAFAERSNSIPDYEEHSFITSQGGWKFVVLSYAFTPSPDRSYINLYMFPSSEPWDRAPSCTSLPRDKSKLQVRIQDQSVVVYHSPGDEDVTQLTACWESDGRNYSLSGVWQGEVHQQSEVVKLLESIE